MNFDITAQTNLEELYSKYQLHHRIQQEFVEANFANRLEDINIPVMFGLDMLTQMVLHKRTTITVLAGILRKHFRLADNPAQECVNMITKMLNTDMVDYDPVTKSIIMAYDIEPATREMLDMFQYPLPMVEEPDYVNHNRQTGYQTIRGSLILRDNHHNEDICLDHVNRSNAIPLSLNANVVAFIQNKWKGLDRKKMTETQEDYLKRVKAFNKYDSTSRDILAALLAFGNRFWLTHKYDKRGRSYCQGYHVNYQGTDWNKAVIEFAETETLNLT